MLTKENIAVLLVGVFVLVVAAYLLFPLRELSVNETKEKEPEPEPEVCPEYKAKFGGKPDVKEVTTTDLTKTVFLGDYGKAVRYLQQRLNSEYGANVKEDGKFGCETYFAVCQLTGLDVKEGINLIDIK